MWNQLLLKLRKSNKKNQRAKKKCWKLNRNFISEKKIRPKFVENLVWNWKKNPTVECSSYSSIHIFIYSVLPVYILSIAFFLLKAVHKHTPFYPEVEKNIELLRMLNLLFDYCDFRCGLCCCTNLCCHLNLSGMLFWFWNGMDIPVMRW